MPEEIDTAEAQSFARVKVDFYFERYDAPMTGTVTVRRDAMVLEMGGRYGPYVIIGEARGGGFDGKNISREGRPVWAKWSGDGETFTGSWIEEGDDEYQFSFRLP